jgi:hypothetical protein
MDIRVDSFRTIVTSRVKGGAISTAHGIFTESIIKDHTRKVEKILRERERKTGVENE